MRLSLYEGDGSSPIAYVENLLFNAISFRQKTFKLSLVGLVMSMTGLAAAITLVELFDTSLKADILHRLAIMMFWFQFVGHTGVLSLPFPAIYTNFVRNFAWTLGLVSNLELQNLSTWLTSTDLIEEKEAISRNVTEMWIEESIQHTITDQLTDFVQSLNIPDFHAFPTVFQVVLFTTLGICGLFGILWLSIEFLYRKKRDRRSIIRYRVRRLALSVLLYFIMSMTSSMVIFCIFEFTLKDITSAGLTLAIVTVVTLSLVLGYCSIKLIMAGVKSPAERAETGPHTIFSIICDRFKEKVWWFIFIVAGQEILNAMLLTFGQTYGQFQVLALIAGETIVLLITFYGLPYQSPVENILRSIFSFGRLLCLTCLLSFDDSYEVSRLTKTRVALFVISLQCLLTAMSLLYILVGLVQFCFAWLGIIKDQDNLTPLDLPHSRRKTFGCDYERSDLKMNLKMPIATTVFPSSPHGRPNISFPVQNTTDLERFSSQSSNDTIVDEKSNVQNFTSPVDNADPRRDSSEILDFYKSYNRKTYAQSHYLSYYGESRHSSILEDSTYGVSDDTIIERPAGLFNDMRDYKSSVHKWV